MNDANSWLRQLPWLTAMLLTACAEQEAPEAVDPVSRPVKLIQISGFSDERVTRYPAIISATERAELSFQVGGLISELPVSASQTVEKGQIIARLDAKDFESSLASARASFTNTEDEYQRAVRLANQDAIAKSVLEQRKTQRDVAQTQLDSAEKALEDTILRAPYSGVVVSLPASRLQTVSTGTTVAQIVNMSSLDATINLPASVIAQVPTREDRGAIIQLEAAPGKEIEAKFSKATLVADSTSQTYAVTFAFSPPSELLVLPGMNATIVLRSSSKEGASSAAVTVPLAAVQSDGNGQYVWRVDTTTMKVSKQPVEIEPGIGETVVVINGLSLGDNIVGAGAAYLADGIQVTPWTE